MTDLELPEGIVLRTPAQRKVWKALAAGAAQPAAAKAGKVSPGTVAKLLRRWRATAGEDLFRNERSMVRAEQTAAAREASDVAYSSLRATLALNVGASADVVRSQLVAIVPQVASVRVDRGDGTQPPVVVHGPPAREARDLALALKALVESAELLDGRPTRHTMRSVPSDQFDPRPLPGAGGPMPREKAEATVTSLTERLREKRAADG